MKMVKILIFFVAQMVPEIGAKNPSLKRRGFHSCGVNCISSHSALLKIEKIKENLWSIF